MISYNTGSSTIYDIMKQKDQLQSFMAPSESVKKVKVRYSNPSPGLDRPWRFQEAEAPRFQDSRHMKVVSLSILRTGRLYPLGNIPDTPFC